MSTTRARCGVLAAGLGLTVLAACPGAASASFTARATAAATVSTTTVAAPTAPTTASSTACVPGLTTSYTVRVSWTASTTPRVSAYRVTETVNGVARAPVAVVGATFTRAATKTFLSTATHSFAVVTVTDYGWTSVPATVAYTC